MQLKNAFSHIMAVCCCAALVTGCSRSITSKTVILTARITVVFDGPVDLDRFDYLLVFSPSPGLTLPANSAPYLYFPTPGRSFNDQYFLTHYGSIGTFYTQYYNTWSDYMLVGRGIRAVYKSGGTQFTPPLIDIDGETQISTANFTSPPTSGFTPVAILTENQLTITFQVDQLTTASQLYMQVATVEKNVHGDMSGYEAGEFRDRLNSPIQVIMQQSSAPQTYPQTDNTDQTGSDILSCTVQIL